MVATEQLTFFQSLDFPGRTTVTLAEIGERLGCTVQHLLNEIDSGSLAGLDLKRSGVSRRTIRVPVECYRNYVLQKLTGPVDFRMRFLRELPAAARRELIRELQASLKTNP
jgi:hypothetical protein